MGKSKVEESVEKEKSLAYRLGAKSEERYGFQ